MTGASSRPPSSCNGERDTFTMGDDNEQSTRRRPRERTERKSFAIARLGFEPHGKSLV